LRQSAQIADPVTVGILKKLRLHAIDDRGPPPRLRTEPGAYPSRPSERLRACRARD
jgi:hypothetical protein